MIVAERRVVEHAEDPGAQVFLRPGHAAQLAVRQSQRQRVDREVAPREVLGQRGAERDVGERARPLVGLAPRGRQVEQHPVRADGRRPEAVVRDHLAAGPLRHPPRHRHGIALDDEIELARGPLEQRVADRAPDRPDAGLAVERRQRGREHLGHAVEDGAGHAGNLDPHAPARAQAAPAADRARVRTRAGAVRERRRGLCRDPEAGRRLEPGRRVPGRAVRHARAGGGARRAGQEEDRSLRPVHLADLRLHARPPALPAAQGPAASAVRRGLALLGQRAARVPARDRRQAAVSAQRPRQAVLHRQAHRRGALAPEARRARGRVARLRRRQGLRRPAAARRDRRRRQGRPGRRARRQDRQGRVEQQAREPQRVVPARRRRPAVLRRRERHGLRDGHAHGPHPLAVPGRRRGQGRCRARRRQALLRRLRRAHLRDPRVRRPQGVGVVEHLGRVRDRGGQLLLDAGRRLRPRLHRQHQRQHLLLQRDERQARLEPRHRRLRLRLTRRRAARSSTRARTTAASTRSTRARAGRSGRAAATARSPAGRP